MTSTTTTGYPLWRLIYNDTTSTRGYKQIKVMYFENSTFSVCVETLENRQTRSIKDVPSAVRR